MPCFTVVGLQDSGFGCLRHVVSDDADGAMRDFSDEGMVIVVLAGWHDNLVKTNILGPNNEFQGKVSYSQRPNSRRQPKE